MKYHTTLMLSMLIGLPLQGAAVGQEPPVDEAVQVVLDSLQDAREPAFLGVYLDENAAATDGVTITGVVEGSAAQKAGLKEGDRLVAVGDHKVGTPDDLRKALGHFQAGSKVHLSFVRGDAMLHAEAVLGPRPAEGVVEEVIEVAPPPTAPQAQERIRRMIEERAARRAEAAPEPVAEGGWLGVSIGEAEGGVAVLSVVEGSPADRAGLKAGDVLRALDGEELGSVEQLVEAISGRTAGTVVRLRLTRGDEDLRVRARLTAREADVPTEVDVVEEEPPARFVPRGPDTAGPQGPVRLAPTRSRESRPETNQEVEELRRANQELRAEIMELREALAQARRAGGGAGMDPRQAPTREMGEMMRQMGQQMRDLGAQVRELGEVVRRQGQALERLQQRIDRGRDEPRPPGASTRNPEGMPLRLGSGTYRLQGTKDSDVITVLRLDDGKPVQKKDGDR